MNYRSSCLFVLLFYLVHLTQVNAQQAIGSSCPTVGWTTIQPNQIVYCNTSEVWALGEEITSLGNVGIGTSTPGEALQVAGALKTTGAATTNSVSSGAVDYFSNNTRIVSWGPNPSTSGGFEVVTLHSDGSGAAIPLLISNSGSIGIGTSNPSAPLHVNGEAIVGSTGLSCASATAGALQYSSGSLQFCNGTAWQTVNAATSGGITPGCGASGSVATQSLTTLFVAAGCNVQFKVWGAGGGGGGYAGGGGGYASMTIAASSSAVTYYLSTGGGGFANDNGGTGGGGPTGFTGGNGSTGGGGGGGSASGVWTGGYGSSGTPVVVAAGGGGSGVYGPGYAAGTGGSQNNSTVGGGPGDRGGGGGGYPTGGLQGSSGNGGYGGTNYAASGGATQTGSGTAPGSAGDANRPTNAGVGGANTSTNGGAGAVYYTTY